MLGAVVRVPQHRLDAARGKRRTGTTAPRRPRGGEAVDGHPQRRPCPVRAGAVRAGSGGGIAPESGMSLALPAARGGSRDLPLLDFAEISWVSSAAGARLKAFSVL